MTTHSSRPIVVGYDGSTAGDAALAWAVRESDRRALPLRVIVATEAPYATRAALGAVYPWPDETNGGLGGALATQARERLAALPGEHQVSVETSLGGPARVLVEASEEAQLVVVGRRKHTVLGEFFLGSISVQVAAHAKCPVIIVEEGQEEVADGHVVVGVDGSEANAPATEFAFQRASAMGVPLMAVLAWSIDLPMTFEAAHLSDAVLTDIEANQQSILTETLAPWSEKYPDVDVRPVLRRDLTVPALLGQSRGAQLIVVGSRGHGGFVGLLLGSVSQGLIHHDRPCPLAVVHPMDHED